MTVKYLLLKSYVKEEEFTNYKGVFRVGLFNRNPFSNDEESLEFKRWLKYVEKVDEYGFFYKLEEAKEALEEYLSIGDVYEIVACIDVTDKDCDDKKIPIANKKFLGFDISDKGFHSIVYDYGYVNNWNNQKIIDEMKKGRDILHMLSLNFFSRNLNKNKLVADYEVAKLLMKTEQKIAEQTPELNTFHIEREGFVIFKLFSIR